MEFPRLQGGDQGSGSTVREEDFWISLGVSVLMMFVTEIGDKTFIVAAVFGSVKKRVVTILAVEVAMALMVLVSIVSGDVVVNIAGAGWVNIAAITCYFLFGILFFRDAWYFTRPPPPQIVAINQGLIEDRVLIDPPFPAVETKDKWDEWLDIFWKVGLCTFFSEWADRSQFSVYRLSKDYNVEGVALGCLVGQVLCSTIAVLGSRYLLKTVSERRTLVLGGVIFLCLGLYVFLWNPSRAVRA